MHLLYDPSDPPPYGYSYPEVTRPIMSAHSHSYRTSNPDEMSSEPSTASGKDNIFSTESTGPDEEDGWLRKKPESWSVDDVYRWIVHASASLKFSYEDLNASAFNITGKELWNLTREDFFERDERYGRLLYDNLHSNSFGAPNMNIQELTQMNIQTFSDDCRSSGIEPAPFGDSTDAYDFPPPAPHPPKNHMDSESDEEKPQTKVKRSPGRPPTRPKSQKSVRLCDFIRNLLHNPETCPSLICWDDHDQGVFRFVSTEKVAKIWGKRKNNEKMNYEKLSRAMRYYYKAEIFLPVPGRKLVYKFGPKAKGWRTDNPNFRISPPSEDFSHQTGEKSSVLPP